MTLEEWKMDTVLALDMDACAEAQSRWDHIAKPLHSLGLLEEAVTKIAGIQRDSRVQIKKKALVIMCADNGIVKEGVTQAGSEVTAVVTENFTGGDSCVCIMAERAGVDVFPVDVGVAGSLLNCKQKYPLIDRKVAYGTKDFLKEPAMTRPETTRAVTVGVHLVRDLKEQGYDLIATGEMGIGNTTTSSAVASVLLGLPPAAMTGKGAGLSDQGLKRKIRVIEKGIHKYWPDWKAGNSRLPVYTDCIEVLANVGGLDIAGLTGVFIGGALYHIPIVIDGFISSVAALAAFTICPQVADYMLASHVSEEPACGLILEHMRLKPLITAHMCLGEGTGAVASVPLLDMAVDVYHRMSTFGEIQIEDYKPL